VGVLIGRASTGTAKVPPAQVISVGGAAAGGVAPTTTPTAPTSETPAANSAKKAAKAKAASSSGTGSSISKPAPPTVLKSVSKGQSGSSYEQKSKNLPDVVETG
jgi:cobalamin biosynthesis Mg chelatase CobN